MKLSIITINYNNAEGLERTLNSVLNQSCKMIEHVIVDGGSRDESVNVIKRYVERIRELEIRGLEVVWSSEPDKGIYNAMNKGIRKASGDYVWILNSGDVVAAPNVIERMMDALAKTIDDRCIDDRCTGIPILLGNIVRLYDNKKEYAPLPDVKNDRCKDDKLTPCPMDVSMLTFYKGTVPQDAAFVRRDLFEKYGYFDDNLKICADWKLYLNMIALGGVQPMYVNIDVVLFDMTGISNANDELRLAERHAYLEEILPASVRKDYDNHAFDIEQMNRLRKHHLYGLVYLIERVLFKLEKWHVLK